MPGIQELSDLIAAFVNDGGVIVHSQDNIAFFLTKSPKSVPQSHSIAFHRISV